MHTDIFYKSNNSHNLGIFILAIQNTRVNIPFDLASRIVSIVSYDAHRQERLQELIKF